MNRNSKFTLAILFTITLSIAKSYAQNKLIDGVHLTTGAGVNKILGKLGNTFRSTIAFNSGFEKQLNKNWYLQAEANFNTLKYDQQQKDDNSTFLFRNTNSSLFMLGLNGGKDFLFADHWFVSLYGGTGYINIGEPRVSIDEINDIVTQSVKRRSGILGKGGSRLGINTQSKIFHTLYIDASYWTSTLRTQGKTLNSVAIFAGMRMAMK